MLNFLRKKPEGAPQREYTPINKPAEILKTPETLSPIQPVIDFLDNAPHLEVNSKFSADYMMEKLDKNDITREEIQDFINSSNENAAKIYSKLKDAVHDSINIKFLPEYEDFKKLSENEIVKKLEQLGDAFTETAKEPTLESDPNAFKGVAPEEKFQSLGRSDASTNLDTQTIGDKLTVKTMIMWDIAHEMKVLQEQLNYKSEKVA